MDAGYNTINQLQRNIVRHSEYIPYDQGLYFWTDILYGRSFNAFCFFHYFRVGASVEHALQKVTDEIQRILDIEHNLTPLKDKLNNLTARIDTIPTWDDSDHPTHLIQVSTE